MTSEKVESKDKHWIFTQQNCFKCIKTSADTFPRGKGSLQEDRRALDNNSNSCQELGGFV